tara:strand:- start:686 stop:1045 length:360 start_codon:yes stop_codon:yes gene_type:complete
MSSHEWGSIRATHITHFGDLYQPSHSKRTISNRGGHQEVERYRAPISHLEMRSYTKTLRSAALTGLAMLAAVAITIHIVLTFFFMHGLLLTMCFLAALILIMPRIGRWHSKRQLHSSTN